MQLELLDYQEQSFQRYVCMYVRKHVYVCMMYAHVDGMHVSCVMYHMRMHVHVLGFY